MTNGFVKTLEDSRRPGWENAYLDYEGLKTIRQRLEEMLVERHSPKLLPKNTTKSSPEFLDQSINQCSYQFKLKLHREIEKVALFCLARLGDLADGMGVLRFDDETVKELHVDSIKKRVSVTIPNHAANELSSLLKSTGSDKSNYSVSSDIITSPPVEDLFSGDKLKLLIGRRFKGAGQPLSPEEVHVYSELGVELLHLVRFATINAAGVRKIVNKYEHMFLEFPLGKGKKRFIAQVKLHEDSSFDRLIQLTSNQSFTAIFASLLDALAECELDQMMSASFNTKVAMNRIGIFETSSDPFFLSEEKAVTLIQKATSDNIDHFNVPQLRLECTVLSYHSIKLFAREINKEFQTHLSRKARIDTGKDSSDMGSSNKKALDTLVAFDPGFLLAMTEQQLIDWCESAIEKTDMTKAEKNPFLIDNKGRFWGGCDSSSMTINLMSLLLYNINYYIISPSASHYAVLLGTEAEFGATLIGGRLIYFTFFTGRIQLRFSLFIVYSLASALFSLFSAFLYSAWYTRATFRSALIFSAVLPLIGNILYVSALPFKSFKLAMLGRFFIGFGSAEVSVRQLISSSVSVQNMTRASALFVMANCTGMSIGPLIAALIDSVAGSGFEFNINFLVVNNATISGFLMFFLWGVQLISLLFLFDEPKRINTSVDNEDSSDIDTCITDAKKKSGNKPSKLSKLVSGFTWYFRVVFQNGAFPTTLFLYCFICVTAEVISSSCAMIVGRYFGWTEKSAGLIVAALGALVIPADFIVERASHEYSERSILKMTVYVCMISVIAVFNFEGIGYDILGNIGGTDSVTESFNGEEFDYDWGGGRYVYIISMSLLFMSSISMEAVNTSLMSKTCPKELSKSFLNMGLMASMVGALSSTTGDSMITACAFFGQDKLHDFVSVTYFPLLPMLIVGLFLVNRYSSSLQDVWKLKE